MPLLSWFLFASVFIGAHAATSDIRAREAQVEAGNPAYMEGKGVTLLGHVDLRKIADLPNSDVSVSNGYAYAGTYSVPGRVYVVDVNDPTNPTVVAVYEPSVRARVLDVHAQGPLLYVALSQAAVDIVDVSDPTSPALLAQYTEGIPLGVHNVSATDTHMFLTNNGNGRFHIVDVSDPAGPFEVLAFQPSGSNHDAKIVGTKAYLANLLGGFQILDISDTGSPAVLATRTYPGAFTHDAWPSHEETYLCTTDETCGRGHLRVWDISNLGDIRQIGEYTAPGSEQTTVHKAVWHGNFVFMSYYHRGLRVADVSNPSQPTEAAFFETWDGTRRLFGCYDGAWGVSVEQIGKTTRIYVIDISTGLWIFDLDAPNPLSKN